MIIAVACTSFWSLIVQQIVHPAEKKQQSLMHAVSQGTSVTADVWLKQSGAL